MVLLIRKQINMSDSQKIYDLIIIGGSAAATAAGIYAARRKLDFKIVTKEFGGEVATSGEIDNWPGMPDTNGLALAQAFKGHLDKYKVDIEEGIKVTGIEKDNGTFCLSADKDHGATQAADKLKGIEAKNTCDYRAKAVIIATGVHPRELNIPGEKELRGKGVTYCTTCDGPLFPDKVVAVVGGGNSALESAIMMAGIAKKVYVVNKNPAFKGDKVLMDKVKSFSNVEIIYTAMTREIKGENFVSGLVYKDERSESHEIKVQGIFVHIGMVPNSDFLGIEVKKNNYGEIEVDGKSQTSVPGIFAAGDVTNTPYKQIGIAVGQGITAVLAAIEHINRLES